MRLHFLHFVCALPVLLCQASATELIALSVDGKELAHYQAKPLSNPKGGKKFQGSNFIHPLRTPSGFLVTDLQPSDHLHHFGLWWPWKFVETNGRKVLFWELQKGDGIIQADKSSRTSTGLITHSTYIDRKAPGGAVPLLRETTHIDLSSIVTQPATGYALDLEIIHQAAGASPLTISAYRYSGFGFRGSALWHKDTSSILTSEGMDRSQANFTRARWVRVQGLTGAGQTAGVLLMSHPANRSHPEKVRTWNKQHKGAVFVNFNPVADKPWKLEPGTNYSRRYRVFVYDGEISAVQAQELWESYSASKARPTYTDS